MFLAVHYRVGRDTRCDKSLRHVAATGCCNKSPRCDKSLRHIAATSRLVCTDTATRLLALSLSLRSVAQIQTGLNSCDRSQRQNSVAGTMIFTCHTRRFVTATCRGDVSQRFVASCVSALEHVGSLESTQEARGCPFTLLLCYSNFPRAQ